MTARRQSTPPTEPGLWKRISRNASSWMALKIVDGELEYDDCISSRPISQLHWKGDIWEGPHAIPTLDDAKDERIERMEMALKLLAAESLNNTNWVSSIIATALSTEQPKEDA